jgi:predicted secreted protein
MIGCPPGKASVLAVLTVALIGLLAVQAEARDLVITNKANGQTFRVNVGEKIMVDLRDPGGGGYNFLAPEYDQNILKMVGQRHVPKANPNRMGDFGRKVYEFQAMKGGETTLIVPIKRPWEKQSETYLKVTVSVRP